MFACPALKIVAFPNGPESCCGTQHDSWLGSLRGKACNKKNLRINFDPGLGIFSPSFPGFSFLAALPGPAWADNSGLGTGLASLQADLSVQDTLPATSQANLSVQDNLPATLQANLSVQDNLPATLQADLSVQDSVLAPFQVDPSVQNDCLALLQADLSVQDHFPLSTDFRADVVLT